MATIPKVSPIMSIVIGVGMIVLGNTLFGPVIALSLGAVLVYWLVR